MSKLCLNMIVKNESAIIERCLASVAPYVDCWVIADTGSTDGTQDIIKAFFKGRDIPGELVETTFENFSQARNFALSAAESSVLEFDYLLLTDADMELKAEDASFKEAIGETPGYLVRQIAGQNLVYDNIRLVKRGVGAKYQCPTHEYVDLPSPPARLGGLLFIDHACGSNRPQKQERDLRLLTESVEKGEHIERCKFYLGQTLYEMGRWREAMMAYNERAAIGGFEEEAWYASRMSAHCSLRLGDEAAYESKLLRAYERRPHRGEPLYDLATWHQNSKRNAIACMYAEEGMKIPFPQNDILFVDSGIYRDGFIEAFAVNGFYRDQARRRRSFEAMNYLCLSHRARPETRKRAYNNIQFYLQPIDMYFDSWKSNVLDFVPENKWNATNASVVNHDGHLRIVVRTVNYTVDFNQKPPPYVTPDNAPITTINYLMALDEMEDGSFRAYAPHEIKPPEDWPEPKFGAIRGFEDLRVLDHDGDLWVSGTVCELDEQGARQIVRAKLKPLGGLSDWKVVKPEPAQYCEKNWMPVKIAGKGVCYLYSSDPTRLIDENGETISQHTPEFHAKEFRGGSQLVPFKDGWLSVVHEVTWNQTDLHRIYFHRFVWFDAETKIKKVSPPFVFASREPKRFEFCAGMAWIDDKRLVVSYGVDDREAHVGSFDAAELDAFLMPVSMFSGNKNAAN